MFLDVLLNCPSIGKETGVEVCACVVCENIDPDSEVKKYTTYILRFIINSMRKTTTADVIMRKEMYWIVNQHIIELLMNFAFHFTVAVFCCMSVYIQWPTFLK